MFRNKENNPLSTTQRNGPAASLHRNLPSEDFFTDSLIDDSRLSNVSQIPSPVKAKVGTAKPRRALGASKALQAAKDSGNRPSRTSLLDYTTARTNKQLKPAPKFSRRKSPSPIRTNGPTTPPQSRHGPPLNSPTEFSSPPGGLHESYQRIADEEDLAATERDVDSDEDEAEGDGQDTFESNVDVNITEDVGSKRQPDEARPSDHSTPVQAPVDSEKENLFDDRTGSLSAPPTLDFIQNEMTDRVLAAKMTPYVVDRAKDRARLERLRQSVPINFGDGSREHQVNGEHRHNDLASVANRGPISFDNVLAVGPNGLYKSYSDTSADFTPQKRFKAFSRATRKAAKKSDPEDDGSDTPPDLRQRERLVAFSKATRRKRELVDETETQEPAQPSKLVAFSRANGRSRPYGALLETNDDQQPPNDSTVESIASTLSEPLPGATPQRKEDATRTFLAKWRKEAAQRRAAKARGDTEDTGIQTGKAFAAGASPEAQESVDNPESDVDWAAAGADVPLPSIEKSSTPRDTPPSKVLPSPISKQRSIDRIRRWENDFTGLSFQVSESPPVRSRNNLNDSLREKEIEDLTKKAVTTNRLDEIRVKDPNVIVRKSSRNFSPEERRSAPPEPLERLIDPQTGDNKDMGQAIPDTPIVVYRSSSQSTDKSKSSLRSMPDSLDQLQRLARAVSTTPRASPTLQEMIREVEDASAISLPPSEDEPKTHSPEAHPSGVHRSKRVAETPKVVGAWTDTILPDTVKTQKQPQRMLRHAQTPHVNAGGWIDTPLSNGDRLPSVPIPEVVEEGTEDITNGDIYGPTEEAFDRKTRIDQPAPTLTEDEYLRPEPQPSANQQVVLPPSALANVLNEAKQKRQVSRDIIDIPRDDTDTLNLGDATIQSMEDLLTDAADITADLTSLIKASAEEEVLALRQRNQLATSAGNEGESSTSEVAFIGHLTSRMERLMSNLHEARKGISRLEQKVSHTPMVTVVGTDQQAQASMTLQDLNQPCTVCGRNNDDLASHVHIQKTQNTIISFMALPIAHTMFTLPIPLLFYPRSTPPTAPSKQRKILSFLPGRPTWLGYLTFALWTWYILECIFTELYARPLYAERVLVAIYRVVGMALGWSDGFVDDARAAGASATSVTAKVAESLIPGVGGGVVEGLSMMNDEVL